MRRYSAPQRGQGVFFADQSSADWITNISGFDFRQAHGQDETQKPDHSVSLGDSSASSTRIRFSVHTGVGCSFLGLKVSRGGAWAPPPCGIPQKRADSTRKPACVAPGSGAVKLLLRPGAMQENFQPRLECEVLEISAADAADDPPLLFRSGPRLAAEVSALTAR